MLIQDQNLFQTKSYKLFEEVGVKLAKSRALALVAVSTNFNDYESTVVSDYFNALLTFLEETSAAFAEIEQHMLRPFGQEESVSDG